MKVILISAKSQHGKDTVANFMKTELERRGERVLIIHFGDPVKFFASKFYNWDGKKDEHGRELLQYIGTGLMRSYNDRYWGDMIADFLAALSLSQEYTYALIPDWRFNSELAAIKDKILFTYTIRINRYKEDGTPYRNPSMTDEQYFHISETQLDNYPSFNFIIQNNGNLDSLYKNTLTIIDYIYEL